MEPEEQVERETEEATVAEATVAEAMVAEAMVAEMEMLHCKALSLHTDTNSYKHCRR